MLGIVRGCLSGIGLICVLIVGGCALSVRGCVRVADPTVWHEEVAEEPAKTRRMLSDFLQVATFEPDAAIAGAATRVAVTDYTDGSIHLTLDGRPGRLVEMVVRVTPASDRARVDVVSDATALAAAGRVRAAYLHQDIRGELERALAAIDRHQPLPGGFSAARLVRLASDERR